MEKNINQTREKASQIAHRMYEFYGRITLFQTRIVRCFNTYYDVRFDDINKINQFKNYVKIARDSLREEKLSLSQDLYKEIEELLEIFEAYIILGELTGEINYD